MKPALLLLFAFVSFFPKAEQPNANSFLKLYTQVSGTGGYELKIGIWQITQADVFK